MSHFERYHNPSPNVQGGIVVTPAMALHWATLTALVVGIMVTTYLLVTRCKRYWVLRIDDWRRGAKKKHDDSSGEDDDVDSDD